ncbi:MAG: protein kinase [Myxococcales bacterium]|nr:protein kinase [Myxococcales bacterium]
MTVAAGRGGTADLRRARGATMLKVAHRRGSAEAALAGEATALAALHGTDAVALLDVTTTGARPALVLEALDGPDLRAAAAACDRRAGLRLVAAAARAVDGVHRAGWVHGDLKPAHVVLVGAPPRARLLDFGAATRLGAAMSTLGTPGYLAPERLAPTVATPTIDVYALGVIAFELWCGRLPFVEVGRAGALAHRDRRVPALPDAEGTALERVVRAALAKDPAARPASAAAFASQVEAALAEPMEPIRPRRPLARGTRPIAPRAARPAALAPPPLIGRADELARLVEAGRAGGRRLITVLADGGHGKSALVMAAAAALRATGARVVVLAGDRPLAALLDALGAVDDGPGAAALRVAAGCLDVDRRALPAAPGAIRAVAAAALAERLRARGADVVVLDDAHSAEPVVLDACERLLATPSWGGAVLAAARPSLAHGRPRWGHGAAARRELTLGPLPRDDARRLVRALVPECASVPTVAIDRVIDRVGAVPLTLIELVAHLRATGRVRVDADGVATLVTDRLAVPADARVVAWVVADELARLPPDLAAVARALAVAGPLPTADRHAVLDDPALGLALDPAVAEARLRAAGVLVGAPEAPRFRHALIRDAVAATASRALRAAVHAAVVARAATLPAAVRAAHAHGAGLAAAGLWREAAEAALARHDYLEAERCATAALDEDDDPRTRQVRARARARLGHHQPALDDLACARARRDGAPGATVALLLEEATALDWLARYQEAAARAAEAAALCPADADAPLRAAVAMARGRAAWRGRALPAAVEALRAALVACGGAPLAQRYETTIACHLMLGWILAALGDLAGAAAHLDDAEALARAQHDGLHLAAVANNRYALHAARGDRAPARAALARFTALARELGLDVTEYRGHYNQAIVACWCDDDVAADAHARAALAFETAAPRRFPRPRAAGLLAVLAIRRGDRAAAATWHAAAVRALATARDEPGVAGDRLLSEALAAALADDLDEPRARALAARARAAGDPELGFELLMLAARAARDAPTARRLAHLARTLPPGLPRLITDPLPTTEAPCANS